MIDRALGFDAPSRRRRADNTSETSSRNGGSANISPARNQFRFENSEDRSIKKTHQNDTSVGPLDTSHRSGPTRNSSRVQSKISMQEINAPEIRNPSLAKPAKSAEQLMRSSTHLYQKESLRHSGKLEEKKPADEWGYKIKLILFGIFSFFLIYNAMIPSRKAPYKKR